MRVKRHGARQESGRAGGVNSEGVGCWCPSDDGRLDGWMDGWIGEGPKDVKVKARSALSFLRSSKSMFQIATRASSVPLSCRPLTRYKNSVGEPNRWRAQRRAADVNVFPRCPAVTPLLSFPLSLGPPPPPLLRSLSASKFRNPTKITRFFYTKRHLILMRNCPFLIELSSWNSIQKF